MGFVYSGSGISMKELIENRWKMGRSGFTLIELLVVIAIIGVLSMMVGFGLMANDDVLYEGPLAAYVGASFSDTARFWHHNLEKAVFLLIALHLLAIAIYRFRFQVRLIPAMVHGGEDQSIPAISKSRQVLGLILLALLIAASQSLSLLGDRFF